MASIEQLLHRRTDLSTFLVHLTRDDTKTTARDNLLSIASSLTIEARNPFGPAARLEPHLAGSGASQKVVSFTETPLEHTWMMVEPIDDRAFQFAPYGLVITKTTARKQHCNPVWYTDISARGGRDWPVKAVNTMVAGAEAASTSNGKIEPTALQQQPIFQITPFVEQMGPTTNSRKEFWWEREWRHVGDFSIMTPSRVVALLVPEGDREAFEADLMAANDRWQRRRRPLLDPRWGVERMIATLSDIDEMEIGPFPS